MNQYHMQSSVTGEYQTNMRALMFMGILSALPSTSVGCVKQQREGGMYIYCVFYAHVLLFWESYSRSSVSVHIGRTLKGQLQLGWCWVFTYIWIVTLQPANKLLFGL